MSDQIFRHDPRNRFEVANANRAAERKKDHGLSKEEAAKPWERERARWVGDDRTVKPHTGGTLLDAVTAAAKRAADQTIQARRGAPGPVPMPVTNVTVAAIADTWIKNHPDYYDSPFNSQSILNFLQKQVEEGRATWSYEAFDHAFEWLMANKHLERKPSVTRKRGEVVNSPAPTIFAFDSQQEIEARQEAARELAVSIENEAEQRAKNLPFEELQKEARSGFKVRTRQQADGVVGAIR